MKEAAGPRFFGSIEILLGFGNFVEIRFLCEKSVSFSLIEVNELVP